MVCWGSSIAVKDKKRQNKLISRAGSVLGFSLDTLEVVSERRMMSKLRAILENTCYPLYEYLCALGSSLSSRLLHSHCSKEQFRRSFVPAAFRLYNSSHH